MSPVASDGIDAGHFAAVQRRTLRVLFATQVISGVGIGIGASVGALLTADLAGVGVSGLAPSAVVVGAALLALPATAIVRRHGRRPSLAAAYLAATLGSIVIVTAAMRDTIPLLFAGFFLFGGATAASFQARYAAVDLAPPRLRGRHLATIVWATTVGAIAGPNLAALAGATLDGYGVPTLAGPFVFSALLFTLAALVLMLLMRPDPAMLARQAAAPSTASEPASRQTGIGPALRAVASHPPALLGITAVAVGHLVMVGVMAMTPVHIRSAGHNAADTLRIVGIVISLHVAGMYAFSPAIGWLTDRFGRRPIILTGVGLLITACALAATAGHHQTQLAIGLLILGLGWSCTMVAGSTLLSESIPVDLRASAQGLSDLTMGLAGASAGALSGVVVYLWGFPMLGLIAALATVPFLAFATRGMKASQLQ
ncbi:MAG TPA: MFS transporter [Vicinamibacterales bacterium]